MRLAIRSARLRRAAPSRPSAVLRHACELGELKSVHLFTLPRRSLGRGAAERGGGDARARGTCSPHDGLKPTRQQSDSGSVLIDALVAIGVIAITLAFAAQAVGDGALRTRAGEEARMAMLEARSRLAEVGGDLPLADGRAGGVDGDLIWTVDIETQSAPTLDGGVPLMAIKVTVGDRTRPDIVSIRSLRAAAL